MIQELLGGGIVGGGGGGERKLSISGGVIEGSSSSSTSSPSSSDHQNLRCPRCDSPNTKFCYYNNYNLTQPRHFCKTCRRYWTKGGALRNVPIGGGCRKNKSASISSTSSSGKSSAGKSKTSDAGKPSIGNGFDQELAPPPSNPILWAPPQNSSLLAFLRSTQSPKPNPNPNSVIIKEELPMIGAPAVSGAINGQTLNLDPLNQVPIGLCSSLWRNSQHQHQQQQHQPQHYQQSQQHSMLLGEVPNIGIQEIYQRIRSSGNYYPDHSQSALSNGASSTSTPALEPASFAAGESAYWNSAFSWPDLPTTNGAFP